MCFDACVAFQLRLELDRSEAIERPSDSWLKVITARDVCANNLYSVRSVLFRRLSLNRKDVYIRIVERVDLL